jgi:hypothetical protein
MTESQDETLKKQIAEGEDAKQLLNNPKISGFIAEMKGALLGKFNATTFSQGEERTEIWRMTKVVEQFEDSLREFIETGVLAIKDQEDTEKDV